MLFCDAPLELPTGRETNGGGVHAPLVHARINGVETLLVVDTGATETLLTRSLLRRLAIETTEADAGVDHAGCDVATWQSTENISLQIESCRAELSRPAVIDGPQAFETRGIGGILCPQALHPDADLILNFIEGRMRIGKGAMTDGGAGAGHPGDLHAVSFTRVAMAGDDASLLVIEAALMGAARTHIMFNTGAWEAELAPQFLSHPPAPGKVRGKGLSGTSVHGRILRHRTLEIGDIAIPVPELILRPQHESIDCQIAMQPLQKTVLALDCPAGKIRWWVPPQWVRRNPV